MSREAHGRSFSQHAKPFGKNVFLIGGMCSYIHASFVARKAYSYAHSYRTRPREAFDRHIDREEKNAGTSSRGTIVRHGNLAEMRGNPASPRAGY